MKKESKKKKSETAPKPKQTKWARKYHAERQRFREMGESEARLWIEDKQNNAWGVYD